MGLHVAIGRANTGKTGLVLEAVRSTLRSGARALLALPTRPDVLRARDEFSDAAPLGLEVSTLDAVLDGTWSLLGDGRTVVGPVERRELLTSALTAVDPGALGGGARTRGFVGVLAWAVAHDGAEGRSAAATAPVSRDLAAVIRRYARILRERGLIERADAHRSICEDVSRVPLPQTIGVNRFTDLTSVQECFLIAAAKRADVWIGLTYESSFTATAAVEPLVKRLTVQGAELHRASEQGFTGPAELVRIERSLFDAASARRDVPAEGAVRIIEAAGERAEAAAVARTVQDMHTLSGIPPGDIAIVLRQPGQMMGALRAELAATGISAEWDVTLPARATGIGVALELALGFLCGDGTRGQLVGFLRTPYAGADSDAVDELDADLRRLRPDPAAMLARAHARGVGSRVLRAVEHAARGQGGGAAVSEWRRALGELERAARPGAPLLDVDALADAAAHTALLGAVTELIRAGRPADGGSVLEALRETRVALTPEERRDRVQVMGPERIQGRRFQCVIVSGLSDGPLAGQGSEGSVGHPDAAEALYRPESVPTDETETARQRLLFYQVVTRARSVLVLSRPVTDEDGKALRPSPQLEELLDLYRDPAADDATGAWYAGEPPTVRLTLDALEDVDAAPRTSRRQLREAAACGAAASDEAGQARLGHARRRRRSRGARLSDDIVRTLAEREVFSVSDIEAYLQCPYRWYYERVLRPATLEHELDAPAKGRLGHEILRAFYAELGGRLGVDRVTSEVLEQARQVHQAVSEAAAAGVRCQGLAEEAAVARVVSATWKTIERDATLLPGFVPRAVEWGFGAAGEDPHDFGSFKLKGRVDRIDVGPDGVIVTDYKLGGVGPERRADVFADQGLVQLPLYAKVVSDAFDLSIAGGLYRSISKQGRPRGFVVEALCGPGFYRADAKDAAQIDALVADAVSRAERAVERMRAGDIAAAPLRPERCKRCPARTLCGQGVTVDD